MNELNNSRAVSRLRVIGIFLLCALLMLLGWYVASGYIETSEKIDANKTLMSVGQLKADQIQSYLADRKGDASVIAGFLNDPLAQRWLTHLDGNAPAKLNQLAESVVEAFQYRDLMVLDANADIRSSAGHGGILGETGKSIALRSMRERTLVFHQIYFGDPSASDVPVLDTFVPIMNKDGTKVVGMVVARSEMNFLFNLLQAWPTESETAESLLVTKDGSDVLFLNDHRRQKNTALKLRIPLSNDPDAPGWPAISAVTGYLGLLEANDYHGRRVLAYTLAVPDTLWGMVVKVEMAEATKRSHILQKFTAMALALILGMAGMIAWVWWRKAETLHELRLMLDTSGEGFWKVDRSGCIIEVNDAYCHFTGYARDEIVGAHVSKFEAIEQTPEAVAEHVRRIVEQGYDRFETQHRHHDGHLIDIEVSASFIPETKCILSFMHDVTGRKRAEVLTQQFGRLLRDSFNEIYLFDAATLHFTQFSEGAKRNLGYSTGELKKLTPLDITPAFTRENFEKMIAPLRNGELQSLHFETFYQRKDGTAYPVEISLQIATTTTTTTTTTTFLAIVQDITERKEAEEKLRRHNEELGEINRQLNDVQNLLLQSDKMASVGQLAAGVAHEINNPIGYVSSNLGTLEEYLKELLDLVAVYEGMENVVADSDMLALAKTVKDKIDLEFLKEDIPALMMETQEGINRVKKIVQDLKDFSRADTGDEWRRVDLHEGLDSTLNVASNEIKYKADIRKIYGDIPKVECLSSQLNQVFMNLLVNAAHAIEKRGIITVRTGQQGGEVWVEIADTGTGIAPEHLKKIFDPFFTTKPVGKGTGLGLSLSYGIIQKHHGRIEVNSEVGKGTSFKVWLPVNQPKGL